MRKIIYTIVLIVAFLSVWAEADDSDLTVSGSASIGYIDTSEFNYITDDSEEGTFQFSEMFLNVSKPINDEFHVGLGLSSNNLGSLGNHQTGLSWAVGDYHYKDYLGFRFGRMKSPLGLYNETREMDMFRTSVLLPSGVYHEGLRDLFSSIDGTGIYGNVRLKNLGSLDYQVCFGTNDVDSEYTTARLYQSRITNSSPAITDLEVHHFYDENRLFLVDLKWETPLYGIILGYSHYDYGTFEARSTITMNLAGNISDMDAVIWGEDMFIGIYSARFSNGTFLLEGEYLEIEFDNIIQADLLGTGTMVDLGKIKVEIEGWYVNSTYRFTELFELGTYHTQYFPTKDQENTIYMKDTCVSLRFDINMFLIFKLEYHDLKGTAYVLSSDNPGKVMGEDSWRMIAAKFNFSF